MAEQETKKETKKKMPTALKRVKQNKVKYGRHRSFKSRVRTAISRFKKAVSEKNKEQAKTTLQLIYKLMDKGVKTGVYKKNKAARTKSRFSLLTNQL